MLHWRALLDKSDAELAAIDLAEANLACLAGLPGAERVDFTRCLKAIDEWTAVVKRWTDAAYTEFFLPNPGEFRNSEAYFRCVGIITALQRHCGVRYDPAKAGVDIDAPFDLSEQFLHGIVEGPGGTCASLPVLYVAIGRRLGYPLKLVVGRHHMFFRWHDQRTGERFNLEGSGVGLSVFDDDYYRKWPHPILDLNHERAYGWLESLTPRVELASFVGQRAYVYRDNHRYLDAIDHFIIAADLDERHITYRAATELALRAWREHLRKQLPTGFPPRIEVRLRKDKRRWPTIPWELERDICCAHTTEWCLNHPRHEEWWWKPLRKGLRPKHDVPTSITVDYELVLQGA
jgi:hypothetical protein